jgi:hypothetical protein
MSEQETMDRMLIIAAYEHIFGGGCPLFWQRTIDGLIARGATIKGKEEW